MKKNVSNEIKEALKFIKITPDFYEMLLKYKNGEITDTSFIYKQLLNDTLHDFKTIKILTKDYKSEKIYDYIGEKPLNIFTLFDYRIDNKEFFDVLSFYEDIMTSPNIKISYKRMIIEEITKYMLNHRNSFNINLELRDKATDLFKKLSSYFLNNFLKSKETLNSQNVYIFLDIFKYLEIEQQKKLFELILNFYKNTNKKNNKSFEKIRHFLMFSEEIDFVKKNPEFLNEYSKILISISSENGLSKSEKETFSGTYIATKLKKVNFNFKKIKLEELEQLFPEYNEGYLMSLTEKNLINELLFNHLNTYYQNKYNFILKHLEFFVSRPVFHKIIEAELQLIKETPKKFKTFKTIVKNFSADEKNDLKKK